ncbi:MAG TPA: TonB-dependent receptor, partial [Verrucomicrobiae bacterium]|nr:TonB-dependent receptor [Verrucomicrobiae bacterium]
NPPALDATDADFQRITAYGYYTLEPISDLSLTAGVAYDRIVFPRDYRDPPITSGEDRRERINPKAALVWSPRKSVTFRGAFAKSLGGVSFDESFRLEPTQLAGFDQSFRSVISESVVGSVAAPTYQLGGAAVDLKFPTHTYFGIEAQLLSSQVRRTIGSFDRPVSPPVNVPSSTPEHLDYDEQSLLATANQLLAQDWSIGAQYRFTKSQLHTLFPDIPASVNPGSDRTERADLHQVNLYLLFNHPSGFFARADTQWYLQRNSGYSPSLPSDDFFQHNLLIGYRLRRHRGELSFGVLNLTGRDYRLNPLNLYSELPRDRVFIARLKINL